MRSLKAHLQYLFGPRFITTVEIIGYMLSVTVGAGFIYTLVAREDVLAYANGPLQPKVRSICVDKESLIFQWLVQNEENVDAGTPLARLVTEPVSRHRLHASRYLALARTALQEAGDAVAMELVDQAADSLGAIEDDPPIVAPEKGILKTLVEPGSNQNLPRDTAIASICSLTQLNFSGTLEDTNARKVQAGQPVRAAVKETGETLQGVVSEVSDAERMVRIQFENPGQETRRILQSALFQSTASPPVVRAEIVVGSQSLFVQVFGRSR